LGIKRTLKKERLSQKKASKDAKSISKEALVKLKLNE
jgi:hypothetical protein